MVLFQFLFGFYSEKGQLYYLTLHRRVDKTIQRINFEDTAPQPGPRHGLNVTATELDYFQLFFSEAYMQSICEYTHKNATRKRQEDPEHNKGK